MITANRIREYLTATPFQPFRLYLSDGSHHDIPHPEFAWLFGGRVYIGIPGKHPFGLDDRVKELSVLHVTRLETLPKSKSRKKQHDSG
jgi:hypothetical protein